MKKLAFALSLACLFAPGLARAQGAYVTNFGANTVSVIDTATNTVVATIPVGVIPIGVVVTPMAARSMSPTSTTAPWRPRSQDRAE